MRAGRNGTKAWSSDETANEGRKKRDKGLVIRRDSKGGQEETGQRPGHQTRQQMRAGRHGTKAWSSDETANEGRKKRDKGLVIRRDSAPLRRRY